MSKTIEEDIEAYYDNCKKSTKLQYERCIAQPVVPVQPRPWYSSWLPVTTCGQIFANQMGRCVETYLEVQDRYLGKITFK